MENQYVWTERITNIKDFEKLTRDAKMITGFLSNAIKRNDEEAISHYLTVLQRITQEMIDFEFYIDKRKVFYA